MRKINEIVIHCSATKANVDENITLPGEDIGLREIDKWHRARGFNRIGYHYVIRRDGTVEPGRPVDQAGAHVENHNANSIGICLVGGVDESGRAENNFEPAQWRALKALIIGLSRACPLAAILGHRDYPGVKKDCPCFDARAWAVKERLA
jgi:N-acetylmuramoyl-L-alanine amidase